MATLCEFVIVAWEMVARDRGVPYLPHEFPCNAVNCLYKQNKQLVMAGNVQCSAFLHLLCVTKMKES